MTRTSWINRAPVNGFPVQRQTGQVRVEYFEPYRDAGFPESDRDLIYTITSQDRADRLADTFYGDPRLWWVLAEANDWFDPVAAMIPGVQIRIPDPDRVRSLL